MLPRSVLRLWLLIWAAGMALLTVSGKEPSSSPSGQIVAVQVQGKVEAFSLADAKRHVLQDGDPVAAGETVVTSTDASVTLVCSNGATLSLRSNSQLAVNQFLQDPFDPAAAKAGEAEAEPSVSLTRLNFDRGEVVGHVRHLQIEKGSEFTVETPVGAAGIRGTAFVLSYDLTETGEAVFQLGTESGQVVFKARDGRETSVAADRQMVLHAKVDKTGVRILRTEVRGLPPEIREAIRKEVQKASAAAEKIKIRREKTKPERTAPAKTHSSRNRL